MTLQLDRIVTLGRVETVGETEIITSSAFTYTFRWAASGLTSGRFRALDANYKAITTWVGLERAAFFELSVTDRNNATVALGWPRLLISILSRGMSFLVTLVEDRKASGDPFNDLVPAAIVLSVIHTATVSSVDLVFNGIQNFTIGNPGGSIEVTRANTVIKQHKLWARRSDSPPRDQLELLLGQRIVEIVRYATWTFRTEHGLTIPAINERFLDDEGQLWLVKGEADVGRRYRRQLYCQALSAD